MSDNLSVYGFPTSVSAMEVTVRSVRTVSYLPSPKWCRWRSPGGWGGVGRPLPRLRLQWLLGCERLNTTLHVPVVRSPSYGKWSKGRPCQNDLLRRKKGGLGRARGWSRRRSPRGRRGRSEPKSPRLRHPRRRPRLCRISNLQ